MKLTHSHRSDLSTLNLSLCAGLRVSWNRAASESRARPAWFLALSRAQGTLGPSTNARLCAAVSLVAPPGAHPDPGPVAQSPRTF